MTTTMKIVKQSRKFIKPLLPTPRTLDRYNLGFIDEFAAAVGVSVVLFFSTNSHDNLSFVSHLETSLGKTLTRFYPLAGRYVEETASVDCNDQGVEFTYATSNVKLQDFLASQETINLIDEFIPSKLQKSDPLLATQVTTFQCGGVAIGVSANHKIADASTLCTLVHEWAIANREETKAKTETETEFIPRPGYTSSSLFPPRGLRPFPMQPMDHDKYTRKKLSFSWSFISNMKSKAKNRNNRRFSKVQLVSTIIWKAFIAVDLAKFDHPRDSILAHTVNLRERMASSIPKDSCGNLWALCTTESCCKNLETTAEELVDSLHDSIKNTVMKFSKGKHDSEEGEEMVLNALLSMASVNPESTNVIFCTSWCRFPFYEGDFGFGKPIWAVPGNIPINQSAYLMDDIEGNGVDAYVFLEVKDLAYFEEALELVKDFDA